MFNSSTLRDDLWAALIELTGTTFFLLFGLGGIQAAARSSNAAAAAQTLPDGATPTINTIAGIDQLFYISTSMGLSLLVSAWLFYRASGGVFNPAVATALLLTGVISPVRWALYCAAQLIGGIVASALLLALLPGPLAVGTALGPGVNKAQGVFIEAFLTAFLVLSVLMLAAEKHKATAFAPVGIGLCLFAAHLWGVVYTGAAMNTARAFGPAIVSGFSGYHWVYWVGPFIGSLIATAFYWLLKHIHYDQLVPTQDSANAKHSPEEPATLVNKVFEGAEEDRRSDMVAIAHTV